MLRFLKSFFVKSKPPVEPAVPYKIETPAPAPVEQAKCGCGRSASGFCVGLHKLTAEEWAAHPDNPVKPEPKTEVATKPAVQKPAVKQAAPAKKPAAKKAPAATKATPAASTRKTKKPAQ